MDIGGLIGGLYTGCGLEDLYGSGDGELASYLWGEVGQLGTNQYPVIAFWTLAAALAVVAIYYYVLGTLLRRPSWGNGWTWLIALGVSAFIGYCIGWNITAGDYYAGYMTTFDARTGAEIPLPISEWNCSMFGFVNAIWGIIYFLLGTALLKWWSADFKHIPF